MLLERVAGNVIGPTLDVEAGGLLIRLRILQNRQDLVFTEMILLDFTLHPDQAMLMLLHKV